MANTPNEPEMIQGMEQVPVENTGDSALQQEYEPVVQKEEEIPHEEAELEALKQQFPTGRQTERRQPDIRPGLFAAARGGTYHTISGGSSTFQDPERAARRKAELELYHSMAANEIITGKCYGIQRKYDTDASGKVHVFATYAHGPFVVYIPIEEYTDVDMEELNERQRERGNVNIGVPETTVRYLQNRLDAEIDFIVTHIPRDEQNESNACVLGSRLKAMRKKRIMYWYGKTTDGKDFMNVGDKAEARIIAVARLGIRVEVFGVETFISYRELSWAMVQDARTMFYVGHTVPVRITSITRNRENDFAVEYTASVKDAQSDPRDIGMDMFEAAGEYRGVISYIRADGEHDPRVFVKLADGVQCMCAWPHGPVVPMVGCEVRVFITHQRKNQKHLFGRIMYVTPQQAE